MRFGSELSHEPRNKWFYKFVSIAQNLYAILSVQHALFNFMQMPSLERRSFSVFEAQLFLTRHKCHLWWVMLVIGSSCICSAYVAGFTEHVCKIAKLNKPLLIHHDICLIRFLVTHNENSFLRKNGHASIWWRDNFTSLCRGRKRRSVPAWQNLVKE